MKINRILRRINFIIMNKGTVKFFNDSKGFGFIKDSGSDKEYFVHVSIGSGETDSMRRTFYELR